MVKGRFKCLGSRQHLKNKFGNVYRLTAKINIDKNEDKLGEFKNFIATAFPGNKGRTDCDNYVNSYMLFCCMSSIINFFP